MSRKSLKLQQMDRRMQALKPLRKTQMVSGWIKATREALAMSAEQLASRLSLTRQGVSNMERREKNGNITLQALQQAAQAMDMQLVYGFVPAGGTLDELLTRKARELATRIVMRTHQTMNLEDQANADERIQTAINEMTLTIKNEMPKALWE